MRHARFSAGLITRSFHGFQNVQEVECNGETLDADASLLYMVLYSPANGQLIASVNVATGECLTSGRFSSCLLNKANFRQTKLRTLLVDLQPGESRGFGCNITGVEAGGNTRVLSQVLVVRKSSEFSCFWVYHHRIEPGKTRHGVLSRVVVVRKSCEFSCFWVYHHRH